MGESKIARYQRDSIQHARRQREAKERSENIGGLTRRGARQVDGDARIFALTRKGLAGRPGPNVSPFARSGSKGCFRGQMSGSSRRQPLARESDWSRGDKNAIFSKGGVGFELHKIIYEYLPQPHNYVSHRVDHTNDYNGSGPVIAALFGK